MKTIQSNFFSKNIYLSIFLAFLFLSFTSCAKKVAFQSSSVVPAARGQVTIKKDDNNNYLIKVKIDNLAEVKRLESSKNTYVVWIETEESLIKNVGQINSDTNFLSSKLKASFETVTAFKPSKIFITAEDNADVQYPSSSMILETKRF